MQTIQRFKRILGIIALAFAAAVPARAAINVTDTQPFTNCANIAVTNQATVTLSGSIIELKKDTGLAILPYFNTTNSLATNALTIKARVSADKVTWSTVTVDYTKTLSGNTAQRGYKYWPQTELGGVRWFQPYQLVNTGTNTIWLTNCVYSRFQ